MVEAYHDNRYAGFVFESLTELHEQFAGKIEITLIKQAGFIEQRVGIFRAGGIVKHHRKYLAAV